MSVDQQALQEVERRVLWLATSIVQAANSRPDDGSGLKVGGHQASSASLVGVMTALWFDVLTAEDRVSVKPHASPVLHAVNHLLGPAAHVAVRPARRLAAADAHRRHGQRGVPVAAALPGRAAA